MPGNEEINQVREIIRLFLKSKKILKMYPSNNPLCVNITDACFAKFTEFFSLTEKLSLKIGQNHIFYDSEPVYSSTGKEDNLALFFFKDGLREITFRRGLSREDMYDFLKIISFDFSGDSMDDDVVTLLWEKDFQNIQYVVDEITIVDEEDYDSRAVAEIEDKSADEVSLLRAYEDTLKNGPSVKELEIASLTDKDLQDLAIEFERDTLDKTGKLVEILFEMFLLSETEDDFNDLTGFFAGVVEYVLGREEIDTATGILLKLNYLKDAKGISDEIRYCAKKILVNISTEKIINLLGNILDGGSKIKDKKIEDFIKCLDIQAIKPLILLLGELKKIHSRKLVVEMLVILGKKNMISLIEGLNDSRWFVVRNIIYVLRKIGDRKAVDYLLKTLKHGDTRVKKEVIRAFGELGGTGVLQSLSNCLDDPDFQIESAALTELGNIGFDDAKRIILKRISDGDFGSRAFEEKKKYFEVISKWKDKEVCEFMADIVGKKTFFGRTRNYENRACAAYSLGLIGNREYLPLLNNYRNEGNRLLNEYVTEAIRQIEHEK
ncbi:MAG: HEAT repeat domain-containing protein [Desulfobacteraceae bacterium]|nr:MAG: HEAT repeat domain-containing protein [Desulfobacteraceae bacterium]